VIALDASVLVAHLYPHDAHHAAATQFLRDAASETLITHTLTLAEVLVGGVKASRGPDMLTDLQAAGVQIAPHIDDEPLRLANLRAATGLKLPDCCVLDTALSNIATLATFDRALARAAQQLDVVVVP
jgi:predicted nucleic acid-binding protein